LVIDVQCVTLRVASQSSLNQLHRSLIARKQAAWRVMPNDRHTKKSSHSVHDQVQGSATSRDEPPHRLAVIGGGKRLQIAELGTAARHDAADYENAPRRTRTFDPLIKSQLLYQLS
jgi:hypothetical protein